MTGPEVLDVARDAIMPLVIVSAPLMLNRPCRRREQSRRAQALSAGQEMTLVFVPVLAMFVAMLLVMPFMAGLAARSHDADLVANHTRRLG